jgi:hypothetical protein
MIARPWLWPDHAIGKRESRTLRDEHNATANEHADLLAALRWAWPMLDRAAEQLADDEACEASQTMAEACAETAMRLRSAIAKAEGVQP